jgi:hypothetical protein
MCQDLRKCMGQSGLTLLIYDSCRADTGGCSMTRRHDKTSRAVCGSSPYTRATLWEGRALEHVAGFKATGYGFV